MLVFAFGLADGVGMGTACAGTVPTGVNGEVNYPPFTRASTRYCFKNTTLANIQNGDLVLLSANQPAVEPGFDGSGILGFSGYLTHTNVTLYSQQFDDASWLKTGVVAAAPTVTADYGTSPDGTQNADRVQFDATTTVQLSILKQAGSGIDGVGGGCRLNGTASSGVFVKSLSGSGTIDVGKARTSIGPFDNNPCAINASTWTWCKSDSSGPSNTIDATGFPYFGNASLYNGAASMAALDVLVWQADCQNAANLRMPVLTTSLQVATAPDMALNYATQAGVSGGMSMSADFLVGTTANSQAILGWRDNLFATVYAIDGGAIGPDAGTGYAIRCVQSVPPNMTVTTVGAGLGAGSTISTSGYVDAGQDHVNHVSCYWDGLVRGVAIQRGTFTTGANVGVPPVDFATIQIGGTTISTLAAPEGVIRNVCISNASGYCR